MRIIKEASVGLYKVTIFNWNNKYLLKFEDGLHELTYKISQLDITSEIDLDVFLNDPEVLAKVNETFEKMNQTLDVYFTKI
jgi:hypothetical protein